MFESPGLSDSDHFTLDVFALGFRWNAFLCFIFLAGTTQHMTAVTHCVVVKSWPELAELAKRAVPSRAVIACPVHLRRDESGEVKARH